MERENKNFMNDTKEGKGKMNSCVIMELDNCQKSETQHAPAEIDQTANIKKPFRLLKIEIIGVLAAIIVIMIIAISNSQINKFVRNWNIQAEVNPNGITNGKLIKRSDLYGYMENIVNPDIKIEVRTTENKSISEIDFIYLGKPSNFSKEEILPFIKEIFKILDLKEDTDLSNKVSSLIIEAKKTNLYDKADRVSIRFFLHGSTYYIDQYVDINYEKLLIGTWDTAIVSKDGVSLTQYITFKEKRGFVFRIITKGYYNGVNANADISLSGTYMCYTDQIVLQFDEKSQEILQLNADIAKDDWDFKFISINEVKFDTSTYYRR